MTYVPDITEEPLTDCCKKFENLDHSEWSDGVEFEVWECRVCKRLVVIDIEIVRDWASAKRVKS